MSEALDENLRQQEVLSAQIAASSFQLARRDAYFRLRDNPDFQSLILKDWCVDEPARLMSTCEEPGWTEEMRQDSIKAAAAPGHLQRFLRFVETFGNNAEAALRQQKETLEELRSEAGRLEAGAPA